MLNKRTERKKRGKKNGTKTASPANNKQRQSGGREEDRDPSQFAAVLNNVELSVQGVHHAIVK